MRYAAVLTTLMIGLMLLGSGVASVPVGLSSDLDSDLPPDACRAGSAPAGAANRCHHVHVRAAGVGWTYQDDDLEDIAGLTSIPVTGVVVAVKAGDFVLFHDHSGVSHTATSGLVMEGEPTSVSVPNVVSKSTRLNEFDVEFGGFGTGFWKVPTNLASTGEASEGAFAYYCKVPLHTVLGMHGVVVVT